MIKALKSKTVWVIVLTFIVGGTEAIAPFLPPAVVTTLLGVLSVAAVVFKLNPSQEY